MSRQNENKNQKNEMNSNEFPASRRIPVCLGEMNG